jgi:hypothetical protein
MPRFHPALADWLRTHHGVVSVTDLERLGITRSARRSLLACGELTTVHEGVYRHCMWPHTMLSELAAACAADPAVVVCCGGASRLWRMRRCGAVGVHLVAPGPTRPFDGALKLHRCPVLPADHVHVRPDGIRVTSPARMVFDLARHLQPLDLESVIEQGIRRSMFDIPTLYAIGRQLCRRGRGGSTRFREVVSSRPAWRRPAGSHPEVVLRDALSERGVQLVVEPEVRLRDGRVIHPDLGDPASGFYIEIDDHEWHGGRAESSYDDRRDRSLRLIGARVERVSTDEIAHRLDAVCVELLEAIAQHRRSRSMAMKGR